MGTMTRTRQAAASRLIGKFERAIAEMHEAEQVFNAVQPTLGEAATLLRLLDERTTARRRYNMLKGTLWRALVNSVEEL